MMYTVGRSVEVTVQNAPLWMINMLFGGIVSGKVGYDAYADAVGWRAYNGDALPQWSDLPEKIRSAWDDAAYAIVEEATRIGETGGQALGCACGHMDMSHDVAEADGSGRRCCVDGCGCGSGS